ncbi:MAG: nitrilase-related carbon-nitrogen hydrolase [Endozoicomonas sp.]|uniref:nitrilase-related carbon-nitrogen hydrolase n=1 Tax=Endozoicomonas sp. TaxID=1892382 RepID=UPI003D9BD8DC
MNGIKSYNPVVQTYIKDCQSDASNLPDAIAHPPLSGEGVRYAIAQGPSMVPHKADKNTIEQALKFNFSTLQTACSMASKYNVQLITFPELFLTGYEFANGDKVNKDIPARAAQLIEEQQYREKICTLAIDRNMTIVCPMPYKGKDPKGNEGIYDTAFIFQPDGIKAIQFKNHLWGFDERLWFRYPEYPELSSENNFQNKSNAFTRFCSFSHLTIRLHPIIQISQHEI